MGIQNVNEAKCDSCGKTLTSTLKKADFLRSLYSCGWKGDASFIKCPACSESKSSCYYIAQSIKKYNGDYYVRAVLSEDRQAGVSKTIFIPYSEFAHLGGNELPTIRSKAFLESCAKKRIDPNKISLNQLDWPFSWEYVSEIDKKICVTHIKKEEF